MILTIITNMHDSYYYKPYQRTLIHGEIPKIRFVLYRTRCTNILNSGITLICSPNYLLWVHNINDHALIWQPSFPLIFLLAAFPTYLTSKAKSLCSSDYRLLCFYYMRDFLFLNYQKD